MVKRLYLLTLLACLSAAAGAVTKTAVFDFSSPEALAQLGLPTPTSSNPTYLNSNITVGDITLIPGSSSPRSTYYQNQYTFYTTSGNTFSFQAASGATITRVDFDGFYAQQRFTASPAGFDSGNTYWSGSTTKVTFTGTGGNSLFSMTVTYEMEEQGYNPLDVNRDGAVTSADVTCIYDYLLAGDTQWEDNADVNGDGAVTSNDITAIYNYLLTGSGPVTVPMPTFSHPSGTVFNTPTTVTVTGPQGSRVYVTTDGTTPSTTNYEDNAYGSVQITVGFSMTLKAIAIVDGNSSAVATAVYTYEPIVDNNLNANWKETSYNIPQSGPVATTSSATYNQAWRIEYPHITPNSNHMVVVHATSDLGISLSLELDKSQRANHWTCFTMHNGVPNNNVGRTANSFHPDDYVPSAYQVAHNEYTSGKYTTSCTNLDGNNMTLFARGHICASEDRQTTEAQNYDTFITSNIHPQYQAHNAGLWQRMETKVQNWGYSSSFRDTLYVCKGATIDNVTLNGSTQSGLIPKSEVLSKFGVNITGTLPIPRYWYMAVLRLKNGQYQAMAYWTEQINSACNSTTLQSCMITIDELEQRTGIDFFCNLPDDIEETVEATLNTSIWQ